MKRCFKCGIEKPLNEFYGHHRMADRHLNKCKACAKLDVRTHRSTHDSVRVYDHQRAALPHRVALRARTTKAWRAGHREWAVAQCKAARATASGDLVAPDLCEGCGLQRKVEKHHPDYSRPLLVLWFCKPCHAIADKIRRRLESA